MNKFEYFITCEFIDGTVRAAFEIIMVTMDAMGPAGMKINGKDVRVQKQIAIALVWYP